MWTAQIARTERKGDRLDIIVHYINGTNEYDQTISTNGIETDSWLSEQINLKLNQLNNLDQYQAKIESGKEVSMGFQIDPNTNVMSTVDISVLGKDL